MKVVQSKLTLDENIHKIFEEFLKKRNELELINSARKALDIATQYQNNASLTLTSDDFLSYLLYIFPRTYLADKVVFSSFLQEYNSRELSILDLGCGLAPATLAMLNTLHIENLVKIDVYLNDLEKTPTEFAGEFILKAFPRGKIKIRNLIGDYTKRTFDASFDLILLSFSLEELSGTNPKAHLELITELQGLLRAGGKIFITHPADKRRSANIMQLRDLIPEYILAPCTHSNACPLLGGRDWCHFTFEWIKPSILQNIFYKLGCNLPDVKFSYLVVSKEKVTRSDTDGRIINRILNQKGVFQFKVCNSQGISNCRVLKRHLKDDAFPYSQNDKIDVQQLTSLRFSK